MLRKVGYCFSALLCVLPAIAQGQLYISNPANYGTALVTVSDCDDCFEGPIAFPGSGQTLNFFGTVDSGLFVSSNGYVTFGSGSGAYITEALNTQTIGRMIAGYFTDLDSRNDAASQVFVNTATPGQIVVTFAGMGHFSQNYSVRSTFQLVIRSDQFAVPAGEGRIGFFYASVTDTNTGSAGFGDGLGAINPGEVAFFSGPGTGLSNSAPRWFNVSGGVPTAPPAVVQAVPAHGPFGLALLAMLVALAGWVAIRGRA
jgi:hypothetical protein